MTTVATSPEIEGILKAYDRQRQNLIPLLQDVQHTLGYLSEEAVNEVAEHLNLSANDVYGVATFYTQFRFTRAGRHHIRVCQGTACHVRGSGLIVEEVSRKLGIVPGETTEDGSFSLERVACYGSCALAPVVVVGEKVYGRMTPKKMIQTLDAYREESEAE